MPKERKVEDEDLEETKTDSAKEDLEEEQSDFEDEENKDDERSSDEIESEQSPQVALLNLAPTPVPQIINGAVVPRAQITGLSHSHIMTGYIGAHTSKAVSKPTTHVRFSHPGLKAMVVRKFANTKIATQFLRNPNNAPMHPVFVDPDSVHHEELQETVGETRRNHNRMKRVVGLIDAPIGSPKEFADGDYQPE